MNEGYPRSTAKIWLGFRVAKVTKDCGCFSWCEMGPRSPREFKARIIESGDPAHPRGENPPFMAPGQGPVAASWATRLTPTASFKGQMRWSWQVPERSSCGVSGSRVSSAALLAPYRARSFPSRTPWGRAHQPLRPDQQRSSHSSSPTAYLASAACEWPPRHAEANECILTPPPFPQAMASTTQWLANPTARGIQPLSRLPS